MGQVAHWVIALESSKNDTWIRDFALWWVRGSVSPSGSKVLQVDSRTEDQLKRERTQGSYTSVASWLILSQFIYILSSLLWAQEAGVLCKVMICCWFHYRTIGWLLEGGEEEKFFLLGGVAGLGPSMVVTLSELYFFINKSYWGSSICTCFNDVLW